MTQERVLPAKESSVLDDEGWNARHLFRLVVLILAGEYQFMTYALPAIAIVPISASFHTQQGIWVQVAFSLAGAIIAPFSGRLADQLGKRRLLLAMVVIAIIGSLISAFAPTYGILLVGRVLQGTTLGLAFLNASIVRDIFPRKILPLAISLVVTGTGVLGIGASLASGWIISKFGWSGVFWMPAIYAAIVFVLILAIVPESPLRTAVKSFDVLGGLLLGCGLAGLLIPISLGSAWGWTSFPTICIFVLGIILLAGWVLQALRSKEPLIAIREFTHFPLVASLVLSTIGIGIVTFLYPFMPYILLTPGAAGLGYGLGLTLAAFSLYGAAFTIGSFLGGAIAGMMLRRISISTVFIGAAGLAGVAYLIAIPGMNSASLFLLSALLVGLAAGGIYAVIYNLVTMSVPARIQSAMSAAITVGANVGLSVVSVAGFAMLNSTGIVTKTSVVFTAGGMHVVFISLAVLAALLVVLGFMLSAYQRRHPSLMSTVTAP